MSFRYGVGHYLNFCEEVPLLVHKGTSIFYPIRAVNPIICLGDGKRVSLLFTGNELLDE